MRACPHIRKDGAFPLKGWQDCACGEAATLDFGARYAIRLQKRGGKWCINVWAFGISTELVSAPAGASLEKAKEDALVFVERFFIEALEAFETAREQA